MILKSYNLGLLADILPLNGGPTFHDVLQTIYKADSFPSEILQMLEDGTRYSKQITLGEYEERNQRLYYCRNLFLLDHPPLCLHILQQ
jgi:hypothetical protein